MARNVFISFLGTNNYLQTRYQWDKEEPSKPVRFIQEAILSRIAKDWTENDRIFIFYTKGDQGSYQLNWLNNGHTRFNEKEEKDQEIEKIGLKQRLNELGLKAKIEDTFIPEGFSEDDVWDMFNTVYAKLENDDKIYFDITHAFRSIPLFASSLFNFARYMLNVEVVSVNYGAFEKLGPAYIVKSMPIDKRIAPIVDMTNIVRLQELTETAVSITEFGRTSKEVSQNMIKLTGQEDAYTIKIIVKAVSELDEFIQSNRRNGIRSGSYLNKLAEVKKKFNKSETIRKPVREIINKINEKIEEFGFGRNNPNANITGAIKWAQEFDMLAQAYTLGREYVLTIIQNKYSDFNPFHSDNDDDNERNYREFISKVLTIENKKVKNNELYEDFKKYPYQFFSLLNEDIIQELREPDAYPKLAQYRNIINHGKGDAQNDRNKGNTSYKTIKETFEKSFKKCIDIIQELA